MLVAVSCPIPQSIAFLRPLPPSLPLPLRSIVAALALVANVAIAAGESLKPGKVEVQLIADPAATVEGRPIRVGLRMKMDPGWHTYWKNPGDAGMPTRLTWTLPAGWQAGDIEWPAPERIPVGELASYGYDGEVLLPVLLFAPRGWSGKPPVHVAARAEWLVCKESCLPEAATLALDLKDATRGDPASRRLFDAARARQPRAIAWTRSAASRVDGRLEVALAPAVAGQFFPDREELIEPGDPPRVVLDGNGVRWSARLGVKARQLAPGAPVRGVWVTRGGQAFLVDATLIK